MTCFECVCLLVMGIAPLLRGPVLLDRLTKK